MRRGEGLLSALLVLLLCAALGVQLHRLHHRAFDKDEFSELQNGWSVAQGEVAYRDFINYQTPLLPLTLAGLVTLTGDTPAVLTAGRYLSLGYTLALLFVFFLWVRRLRDRTVALLSLFGLVTAFGFAQKSLEIRQEVPMLLFWNFGILALVQALQSGRDRRIFAAGAALGVATLFKQEAALTPAFLGLAFLGGLLIGPDRRRALSRGLWLSAGVVVPLLCSFAYFGLRGAAGDYLRMAWLTPLGVFGDLFRPGLPHEYLYQWLHRSAFLVAAGVGGALLALARGGTPATRLIAVIALGQTLAMAILKGEASFLQNYFIQSCGLAFFAADIAVTVFRDAEKLPSTGLRRAALVAIVAAVILPPTVEHLRHRGSHVYENRERQLRIMDTALRLTQPGDALLDGAGIYIFRRHASWFYNLDEESIEAFTRHAGELGGLLGPANADPPARIVADVQRTRAALIIEDIQVKFLAERSPPFRQLLERDYVEVAREPPQPGHAPEFAVRFLARRDATGARP